MPAAKVSQDFTVATASGRKNTSQLSFDILNPGNLLNGAWDNRQPVGNNRLIEATYPPRPPPLRHWRKRSAA